MSQDGLIDFAILPHSRVQNYENKIEELSKKVTDLEGALEGSKDDSESKIEPESPTPTEEPVTQNPIVEPPVENAANNDEKDTPSVDVKESLAPTDSKIIKGKNLNKECRTQQLKEKLKDTNYVTPDNIESILAGALGRSKKPLPNEEEFYNTIISNNLISLIRNPHKFKKYIRPSFYKI